MLTQARARIPPRQQRHVGAVGALQRGRRRTARTAMSVSARSTARLRRAMSRRCSRTSDTGTPARALLAGKVLSATRVRQGAYRTRHAAATATSAQSDVNGAQAELCRRRRRGRAPRISRPRTLRRRGASRGRERARQSHNAAGRPHRRSARGGTVRRRYRDGRADRRAGQAGRDVRGLAADMTSRRNGRRSRSSKRCRQAQRTSTRRS